MELDWTRMVVGNIKRLMKEAGKTRNEVARDAGIPRETFYRKLKAPNTFMVCELGDVAEALGVTVSELLI
ncbi:helix-turn-helix transcriptional regulator [Arthrobacter sp. MI7-26]|uniref:helix-turn-helix domain-containing protein n=1 Tax=Arthrobacter sp. MI7-26 TaxID=2993653 RepID=UPI002248B14F|nr:helix-turn-helix transcriptional regulator [Arthrobacter sp. MI7-26]MCX2746704.1 helix-turn-helix transcriptional regulator [Arthrobacter sp. MI7-26]